MAKKATATIDLPVTEEVTPYREGVLVNEHGVVTAGLRTIKVQLPKAGKITAAITLCETRAGEWQFGYEFEGSQRAGYSSISPEVDPVFGSEQEAAAAGFAALSAWLDDLARDQPKLAKAVRSAKAAADIHQARLFPRAAHTPRGAETVAEVSRRSSARKANGAFHDLGDAKSQLLALREEWGLEDPDGVGEQSRKEDLIAATLESYPDTPTTDDVLLTKRLRKAWDTLKEMT